MESYEVSEDRIVSARQCLAECYTSYYPKIKDGLEEEEELLMSLSEIVSETLSFFAAESERYIFEHLQQFCDRFPRETPLGKFAYGVSTLIQLLLADRIRAKADNRPNQNGEQPVPLFGEVKDEDPDDFADIKEEDLDEFDGIHAGPCNMNDDGAASPASDSDPWQDPALSPIAINTKRTIKKTEKARQSSASNAKSQRKTPWKAQESNPVQPSSESASTSANQTADVRHNYAVYSRRYKPKDTKPAKEVKAVKKEVNKTPTRRGANAMQERGRKPRKEENKKTCRPCSICRNAIGSTTRRDQHTRREHPREWLKLDKCPEPACDYRTLEPNLMKKHQETFGKQHEALRSFKFHKDTRCPQCDVIMCSLADYCVHMEENHPIQHLNDFLRCSDCNGKFMHLTALATHWVDSGCTRGINFITLGFHKRRAALEKFDTEMKSLD